MLASIIGLIVIGLVAGYVARAVVPGRQAMTAAQTLLLGVAGSFVGGAITWLVFDTGDGVIQTASWLGSILGAVIVLAGRAFMHERRSATLTR